MATETRKRKLTARQITANKRRAANARWSQATDEQRSAQGMNFHAGLTQAERSARAVRNWNKRRANV